MNDPEQKRDAQGTPPRPAGSLRRVLIAAAIGLLLLLGGLYALKLVVAHITGTDGEAEKPRAPAGPGGK
jgi:hypothetical protein